MANFMNKFLDFMKLGGEEDDYDEDFYEVEEQEEPASSFRTKRESSKRYNEVEEEAPKRERTITRAERAPKLVPMQSGRKKGMGVSIQKPNSFEDSEVICDMLLKGQAVVVNLEGFNPHDAQRIMDFLSGCIYAMDGKLNQIAKYIFLFSPDNVDVSGDLSFDSNGVPIFNREF
ncbi:MAG: cell division protein SepF [Lachnospiraceae bacterium]|nr:cell division protein SepF [Lachnospiraceae bacterium]